jgi:hypothetical protein
LFCNNKNKNQQKSAFCTYVAARRFLPILAANGWLNPAVLTAIPVRPSWFISYGDTKKWNTEYMSEEQHTPVVNAFGLATVNELTFVRSLP